MMDETSRWKCAETTDGNTQLWFNAQSGLSGYIDSPLESVYAGVDGGFDSPESRLLIWMLNVVIRLRVAVGKGQYLDS